MVPLSTHDGSDDEAVDPGMVPSLRVEHGGQAQEVLCRPPGGEAAAGLQDELVGRRGADHDGGRAEEVRPVDFPAAVTVPPLHGMEEAVGAARHLEVPKQRQGLAEEGDTHVARRQTVARATATTVPEREGNAVERVGAVPGGEKRQRDTAEQEAVPP